MTANIEVVVLDEINCIVCGIRFGMAEVLMAQRRKDHAVFYCPNGHPQHFKAPVVPRDEELEQAREELRIAREELASANAKLDQMDALTRRSRVRGWTPFTF